jgi:hypothetical protein
MKSAIDENNEKFEKRCEKNRQIAKEREEKRRAEREQNNTNVNERARTCTNVTNSNNIPTPKPNPNSESKPYDNAGAADEPQQGRSQDGSHSGSSFEPPSVEDVRKYCKSRSNGIDPQRFVDYHTAIGWKLNGSQIVDWKAVVRKWESQQKTSKPPDEDSSIDMDVLNKLMNPYA